MKKVLLAFGTILIMLSSNLSAQENELDWWNETVFYEIFVRSFYDSDGDGVGDFKGLTEKLDYLNDGDPNTDSDLGIGGIWLMPINESPSYHGYDVVNYRTINPDYGTMEDFKIFLEEAHKRGIKVIIDYVMNHSSTEHPWFQASASSSTNQMRDFYVWEETDPGQTGPWGQQVWHNRNGDYFYGIFWGGMPDLNYNNPAVKDSMFAIADYWLKEIGIDGFRLDAIKYIYEEGNILEDHPSTFQFFKDFNQRIKAAKPESFAVGEAWTTTSKVVPYVEGEGVDFCFEFDLASAIIGAVNSGNSSYLKSKLEEVINVYPHYQFGTFLTNHDQNRVLSIYGENEDRNKAAASIYLTIPGIPFIYYGEEIGMLGEGPHEQIREPFAWDDSDFGGFTDRFPWTFNSPNFETHNVETLREDPESLWNHYRNLIQTRNAHLALQTGDFHYLLHENKSLIPFIRKNENETLLVLVNGSFQDIDIETLDVSDYVDPAFTPIALDVLSNRLIQTDISADGILRDIEIEAYDSYVIQFTDKIPESGGSINLYPVPSTGGINISSEGDFSMPDDFQYTITDLKSQNVQSGTAYSNRNSAFIDLSELRNGFYIIKLTISGKDYFKKIIKN